jgi:membrane-associated protease RseP (regulator of RpoE activity)
MPFQRQFRFQAPDDAMTAGVLVREVAADSPAETAGLQARDVITAVDGEAIESPQDVIDRVNALEPGDVLTLSVERPGQEEALELEVTLGGRPDDAGLAYLGVSLGGFFMHMERQGFPNAEGQDEVLPFGPNRSMPFPFQLPFDLEDLPFDLDQLPFDLDELMMPNQPDQPLDGPVLQPEQNL